MYIAILFFLSKVFDLITTRAFLSRGILESNIIYRKYGEEASFYLVYILTFIIYLILNFFGKHKEIKEVLIIYLVISFTIPIFNLITLLAFN